MSLTMPVDLTAARGRASLLEEYQFDVGAETVIALANEVEALRNGLKEALGMWEACALVEEERADIARLRALLPAVTP